MQDLQGDFARAMRELYLRTKNEVRYNALRMLQMVNELGGVEAARRMLNSPSLTSEGLTKLWELGRLDLSVEALVLHPTFAPLFTAEERNRARAILRDHGNYVPPWDSPEAVTRQGSMPAQQQDQLNPARSLFPELEPPQQTAMSLDASLRSDIGSHGSQPGQAVQSTAGREGSSHGSGAAIEPLSDLRDSEAEGWPEDIEPSDGREEATPRTFEEWQAQFASDNPFSRRLATEYPAWLKEQASSITLRPRNSKEIGVSLGGELLQAITFNRKWDVYVWMVTPTGEDIELLRGSLSDPASLKARYWHSMRKEGVRFFVRDDEDYQLLQEITRRQLDRTADQRRRAGRFAWDEGDVQIIRSAGSTAESEDSTSKRETNGNPRPSVWWVNQGASYDRESGSGYVWAPLEAAGGRRLRHHANVGELKPGDIVLHYSDRAVRAVGVVQAQAIHASRPDADPVSPTPEQGFTVRVEYHKLDRPIARTDIPAEWRTPQAGPFDRNGDVVQGYMYRMSDDFVGKFVERFGSQLGVPIVELFKPKPRRIVKIAPGPVDRPVWEECLRDGVIYVGWDQMGDLRDFASEAEMRVEFEQKFDEEYNHHAPQITRKARELWTLRQLEPGDIVVANRGLSYVLGVGEVIGPGYVYLPEREEYKHAVTVRWDTSVAKEIPRQGAWGTVTVAPVSPELYQLIIARAAAPKNVWLFQANPAIWSPARELKQKKVGDTEYWRVTAHRDEMRPGDDVVLWEAGADAGVYALGTLLGKPYRRTPASNTQEDSEDFGWAVDFEYTRILPQPLRREVILADPVLGGRALFKGVRGTNFRVTAEEWEALLRLLDPADAPANPTISFREILEGIHTARLDFPPDLVANYLLALQTKRFVVLTGISGTGKTQLAMAVARCFGGPLMSSSIPGATSQDNLEAGGNNYQVVAVRPDWNDSRGLLGYYNPLIREYVSTTFLQLLLRAANESRAAEEAGREPLPYFAILDEMNLAHVEQYFSDFLSSLESGEAVTLHEDPELEAGGGGRSPMPRQIPRIPTNLFFVGTVNVDETTHMFSPKVLDRAFTIELDHVDLAGFGRGAAQRAAGADVLDLPGFPGMLRFRRKPDQGDWDTFGALLDGELQSVVIEINELLAGEHRHFGYRVATEIARFVNLAAEQGSGAPESLWAALDLAILEKVLPKFNGTQQELQNTLLRLFGFAVHARAGASATLEQEYDRWELRRGRLHPRDPAAQMEQPRLRRTAAKIRSMLKRLHEQGFTSFIE